MNHRYTLFVPHLRVMMPGYHALRESAAWLDLSSRGKITAHGEDRARLLHAMTTNHVEQLVPGTGCYAFFLDAHGHILSDVNVFTKTDHFLLDTEPETTRRLFEHIDRHIIADDVALEDVTSATATLSIEGPKAADVLTSLGAPIPESAHGHREWEGATVARVDSTGAGGFSVFLSSGAKTRLVQRLGELGVPAATPAEILVVRLEKGRPRYGEDVTDKYLPHETQMLHAVHFNKGCYLGQEIVERIRSRGHVNRLLVRLALESREPPAPGTGFEGGVITSAAFSPALGETLAFAYVRAELVRPGGRFSVQGVAAEILPSIPSKG